MLYDLESAKQLFERGGHISRELGDRIYLAWSFTFMGYTMMREKEAALAVAEEGLSLFRELGYKPGIANALNIIGEIANFSGDDQRARRAYEECLVVALETGDKRRIRFMFGNLTFLAQHEGDHQHARELAEKGLQLALEMNNNMDIVESLADLAGPMGMTGQPEQAARLFGAWEAAMERMGAAPQPADIPELERNIATVRAQLAPPTFAAAWANGRAMSLEQAVVFALEQDGSRTP
jgi:tetratricopeptide (TPR) repeat protein